MHIRSEERDEVFRLSATTTREPRSTPTAVP